MLPRLLGKTAFGRCLVRSVSLGCRAYVIELTAALDAGAEDDDGEWRPREYVVARQGDAAALAGLLDEMRAPVTASPARPLQRCPTARSPDEFAALVTGAAASGDAAKVGLVLSAYGALEKPNVFVYAAAHGGLPLSLVGQANPWTRAGQLFNHLVETACRAGRFSLDLLERFVGLFAPCGHAQDGTVAPHVRHGLLDAFFTRLWPRLSASAQGSFLRHTLCSAAASDVLPALARAGARGPLFTALAAAQPRTLVAVVEQLRAALAPDCPLQLSASALAWLREHGEVRLRSHLGDTDALDGVAVDAAAAAYLAAHYPRPQPLDAGGDAEGDGMLLDSSFDYESDDDAAAANNDCRPPAREVIDLTTSDMEIAAF